MGSIGGLVSWSTLWFVESVVGREAAHDELAAIRAPFFVVIAARFGFGGGFGFPKAKAAPVRAVSAGE